MPAAAAPSPLYCADADVRDVLSSDGVDLRLDDDASGVVDAGELARLTGKGIGLATARLNLSLAPRYDTAQLALSYVVLDWCALYAACWLCGRRGNPVPSSLRQRFEEVFGEKGLGQTGLLRQVQDGQLVLDVPQRETDKPGLDNVRVDFDNYGLRKIRVERPLSDKTPPRAPINRDLIADLTPDPL